MQLYLIQHAAALPSTQDPQRPLSPFGRQAAARLAEHLRRRASELLRPPISEVHHSGKLRARQTAEIFARALCPSVTPAARRGLAPDDDPQPLLAELTAIREQPGALMLVGHLPHLRRLAGLLLAGNPDRSPVRFANAGVLKLTPLESAWTLDWYLTPACLGPAPAPADG